MDGTTLMPKLAEPYKKNIGKITFQVTSFGNSQGNNTAQQLILQILEAKVKQGKNK